MQECVLQTVQLVVGEDGVSGLCYEHSPSEGIAVVQLCENIIKGLEGGATKPLGYHPNSARFQVRFCDTLAFLTFLSV